jgi:anaerobic selenocysteine-containing dehydrogenase
MIPGTDVALINSLMHVIIREGLEDKDFIVNRTQVLKKYMMWLNIIPLK